ncbi:hypothetical protein SAMN05444972_11516 [Marininema halotolerans]|uniref:Uncharacterized protein n=1 Tax=Marininema halotolerans TaxID=1155944 RepID=A0A1I6UB71_9BACL|nr:hypothetical protein SAMN05444972_11516 [Marininema halotolerans]
MSFEYYIGDSQEQAHDIIARRIFNIMRKVIKSVVKIEITSLNQFLLLTHLIELDIPIMIEIIPIIYAIAEYIFTQPHKFFLLLVSCLKPVGLERSAKSIPLFQRLCIIISIIKCHFIKTMSNKTVVCHSV